MGGGAGAAAVTVRRRRGVSAPPPRLPAAHLQNRTASDDLPTAASPMMTHLYEWICLLSTAMLGSECYAWRRAAHEAAKQRYDHLRTRSALDWMRSWMKAQQWKSLTRT